LHPAAGWQETLAPAIFLTYVCAMQRNWTLQALLVSGTLNILLVGLLFFVMLKEQVTHRLLPFRPYVQTIYPPLERQAYDALQAKSYPELVALLEDRTRLRAGYRMCDLALGILVTEHDVDVERALGHGVVYQRFFEKAVVLERLCYRDMKKIGLFLRKQYAPFTPYGLYRRLPQTLEAFSHTPECRILRTLLHRFEPACCTQATLLALCHEIPWPVLERLCTQAKERGDLSVHRAQSFFVDAVYAGSRTAAYLLVIHSPGHALEEFDHVTVTHILCLLDVKTQEAITCCQSLLRSHRPVSIVERARAFLG